MDQDPEAQAPAEIWLKRAAQIGKTLLSEHDSKTIFFHISCPIFPRGRSEKNVSPGGHFHYYFLGVLFTKKVSARRPDVQFGSLHRRMASGGGKFVSLHPAHPATKVRCVRKLRRQVEFVVLVLVAISLIWLTRPLLLISPM